MLGAVGPMKRAPVGEVEARRPGRGSWIRYDLRANTAASDGGSAPAWAPALPPAELPRRGLRRPAAPRRMRRARRARGGQMWLTPPMDLRHAAPSLEPYRRQSHLA